MGSILPVVLCGGSGTRLWPRSRATRPKPFIPLLGRTTLYQATLQRCSDRTLFSAPLVVAGRHHLEFAQSQASDIADDASYILEPEGKNTAPAIAMAAFASDRDQVLLVCPSDHYIANGEAFSKAALSAAKLAQEGRLTCFGITATAPETGYGYIRRGAQIGDGYSVESFTEKPDLQTAIGFLESGDYYWNGGIFAFRAGSFLDELERHRPALFGQCQAAWQDSEVEAQVRRPTEQSFAAIDGESVDYAVMENTDRAAMVEADMGWSDIGNWDALMRSREVDGEGNVLGENARAIASSDCMTDTDGQKVTLIGAKGLIVVADGDEILVVSRDAVQRVGEATRSESS